MKGTVLRPLLYLDTARLGQMSPAAKEAQLDFVRLSAEEPSSLYFEQFLRDGFLAWPSRYRRRFPGLRTWNGVAGLKHSIRQIAEVPQDWRVLLASRGLALVRLATHCLFRVCNRVLATDLSWPTYQQCVEVGAHRTRNSVSVVPLRHSILEYGWTTDDAASYLSDAFVTHDCDGLFLPAVDHLGIRLPIAKIVASIQKRCELRFTVVDAAQAFCQVPLAGLADCADFIVAGSQKWMGAYVPSGIGLFGRPQSRDIIQHQLDCLRRSGGINDPLLQFTEQLAGSLLDTHSETANIAVLFAQQGAVADMSATAESTDRYKEVMQLARVAAAVGWRPVQPTEDFRSAILLLDAPQVVAKSHPDALRRAMLDSNVVVSAYAGGRLRLSMARAFHQEDQLMIRDALDSCHSWTAGASRPDFHAEFR